MPANVEGGMEAEVGFDGEIKFEAFQRTVIIGV